RSSASDTASTLVTGHAGSPAVAAASAKSARPSDSASSRSAASTTSWAPYAGWPMPDATPCAGATAAASSTIPSCVIGRSPTACRVTLQSTRLPHLGQGGGELLQAGQVVAGEELVDVRRGHHHAERGRDELLRAALVRVQPDDPVAQPRQPLHRR